MLGLGLTALLASFMSGMAGNVTAFNTVFTYDIYQSYIQPGASDGIICGWGASRPSSASRSRWRGVRGDAVQQHHGHAAARVRLRERALFATFLLGMFWKRATGHGAFSGCCPARWPRRSSTA